MTVERPAPYDRPFRFHISARPGRRLNDPNGPIAWGGRFHLFHQPNWGHAVSDDLVRWTILDDVLPPTLGGPDRGGAWSGCTVAQDNHVYAVYTGVDETAADQVVCVAVADDDLTTWRKLPEPVIAAPPAGMSPLGFRDPFVLRHGERWLCVMGAGETGIGKALLYASSDLVTWTFEGTLYERASSLGDPDFTGEMWECPFFVPVGGRHLLGVSVWWQNHPFDTAYFVGDFDGASFSPTTSGRLDYGPDFYAPTVMIDPLGRCLMWGWVWEAHDQGASPYNHGGALTVARQVTVRDNEVRLDPVDELASLRTSRVAHYDGGLAAGSPVTLVSDAGSAFDLEVQLPPVLDARLEVEVLASPNGEERTVIFIDPAGGIVGIDTRGSVLTGLGRSAIYTGPLLHGSEPASIRILCDGSIVEAFVGGRALTARVSPVLATSRTIRLVARGDIAALSAQLWSVTEQAVEFAS